jgi:hypothetical protein
MVQCKHCNTYLLHPLIVGGFPEKINNTRGGTTSGLSRHLVACGKYKATKSKNGGSSTIKQLFNSTKPFRPKHLTKEDVLDKVLNFFISGNIAFNQADNPHFQDLISLIKVNDAPVTVNRHNIAKQLHAKAEEAREDLLVTLVENDSKISLAQDAWSSGNNLAFLGNTPCNTHLAHVLLDYCTL